jgi:hypothetical protein
MLLQLSNYLVLYLILFAGLDGTLLRDCVNNSVRDHDILRQFPTMKTIETSEEKHLEYYLHTFTVFADTHAH